MHTVAMDTLLKSTKTFMILLLVLIYSYIQWGYWEYVSDTQTWSSANFCI